VSNQVSVRNDDGEEKVKLLSPQERQTFKMISAGEDLNGQRALALLAIDEGATQKEAGMRSGLTPGQVKYWLGRFRQLRLQIFPDQVLENAGLLPGGPEPGQEEQAKLKAKKKKAKKAGKGKKSKKKKDKKAKKSKTKKK
jgi:hypothetical protein